MSTTMKIVQVFKTDVRDQKAANHIILFLGGIFSHCRINFDLEDCDRVLRIENHRGSLEEAEIQWIIAKYGYHCEPLRD